MSEQQTAVGRSIGSGRFPVAEARKLSRSRAKCGRPTPTVRFPDRVCNRDVLPFAPACGSHVTSAEKDASTLASVAFEAGKKDGYEAGQFRQEMDATWGNAEIKARVRLMYQEAQCSAEEGLGKARCTEQAFHFSELCLRHMEPAERNAVWLAETIMQKIADMVDTAERQSYLATAMKDFRFFREGLPGLPVDDSQE